MKHAFVLEHWAAGSDVPRMVELGVAAEEAGWDGVFLSDVLIWPMPADLDAPSTTTTFFPFADPLIVLTAIASRTERIRLGTWITPIPRRQPWQLARDLATLDRLSGGRVILGTGLGRRPDYENFGQAWDQPALGRMYDEALEVLSGLWSGEPFSYEGEFYTVDAVAILPKPKQRPRIPIWPAAIWPNKKPFRRAARWDGVMPHFPGDGIIPPEGDHPAPERWVRDLLEHYHALTNEPGDVFLPAEPPGATPAYLETCNELGVTWLYSRRFDFHGDLDRYLERIREGPPTG